MKLLQRATFYYFIFFLVLLVVSTGGFYFILQHFILRSIDKSLLKEKEKVTYLLGQKDADENKIFDADEEVIMDSVPSEKSREDIYKTIYYQDAWDSISGVSEEPEPHRELTTFVRRDGNLYELIIRKSLIESEDLLFSLVLIEMMIFLVLAGSFLTVNIWISRKLWKPFYESLEKVKSFKLASGEPLTFSRSDTTEFEDLNKVLESMSERIRFDFLRQKQFVENASHELQTPLMVIRSRIELLVQQPGLSEEQVKLLQSIDNASLRLSRLNKALLLLSRIENYQFSGQEEIRLKPLVERIAGHFEDRIHAKKIHLSLDLDANAVLQMDPGLAEILVTNLIQNAVRHNVPSGTISIVASAGSLVCSNSGEPKEIPEGNVFLRFWKSREKEEGTGLGLAIVKEICKCSGIDISYHFQEHRHFFYLKW